MDEDHSLSIDPHTLSSTRLRALWALGQLEVPGQDHFSATQIAGFLINYHKINTSRQAIEYALKKNNGAYHKNKRGYKLMELGRKEFVSRSEIADTVLIEPGKPYTAKNIKIKNVFDSLKEVIYISDPYADINTSDVIFINVPKNKLVRLLTNQIFDKPQGTFSRHLTELRKEGYHIEIGIYTNSEVHDRYLMDDKIFWLSGNSLNHLS